MARQEKVSEALKQEISSIIQSELKDPRLGFITITRVEITHDLRYAKVFFSVLGQEEDYKKTKEALDSGLGFIRRLIAQRIRLRFVPEISFKEDRSAEYSVQIQKALDEVKELTAEEKRKEESEPKKRKRASKK
ncbi:MAG: 30S ribosome-binding factor RbfA [Candidatus Omnitrophica bacterium]|nr:30S ribosome-binding factor RbfA [Candidatus Omnitrophota bacterium]MDD5552940.1 30S ribosome-binding factor RbfA [Candidatus Omnitrophota bacterium]